MNPVSLFIRLSLPYSWLHQANWLLKSLVHTRPYVPLRYWKREIRLLIPEPGKPSDPLRCDFFVTTIDDALNFTALSYSWGDSKTQKPVFFDDVEVQVTEGLATALKELRSDLKPKMLLVDALSINQAESGEKEKCVQMMDDIYRKAARTVVWLGESEKDSDEAMEFVSDTESLEARDWGEQRFLDNMRPWKALKDVMARDWWRRTWTIQEAFFHHAP
jgi:hypothetical protein